MIGSEDTRLNARAISPEENVDGQERAGVKEGETRYSPLLQGTIERLKSFEPADEKGVFIKGAMEEALKDIETTLQEGGEDDTLNLLIAYRGLEDAQGSYGEDVGDVGIAQTMAALKEKIKAKEGFNISEVENLDVALEESKGNVGAILGERRGEEVSDSDEEGEEFGRYLALKQEIAKRQQEILGDSRNFYGRFSQKVLGPLVEYLHQAGEKIDEKASAGNALLQYLGKHKVASKFARGAALGVVGVGALAYIFKGDIVEAAEPRVQTHSSLAELRQNDPQLFQALESVGLARVADLKIEEGGAQEIEQGERPPAIFGTALGHTDAQRFLESPQYRDADTPQELEALYNSFNEQDQDPSDDIAVALKYQEFLQKYPKEKLVQEYGQEAAEKIYQQAGYATFKSLEKYFALDIKDGRVDSKDLQDYLGGFEKASQFYKSSLGLAKELVKSGELHKGFSGMIEMNDTLSAISNTAIISGDNEDKITAAHMRKLAGENIKEFERLETIDAVHLGEGKFLFPKAEGFVKFTKGFVANEMGAEHAKTTTELWLKNNNGGFNAATTELVTYFEKASAQGPLSQEDRMFLSSLMTSGIIEETPQGLKANIEKPFVLLTTVTSYTHENQHAEFYKNDALIKHWVSEWNGMPRDFRERFIKSFVYRNLSNEQIEVLSGNFSPQEIKRIITEMAQGNPLSSLDEHKNEFLQEFMAYSTDNSERRFFNPKYEVK